MPASTYFIISLYARQLIFHNRCPIGDSPTIDSPEVQRLTKRARLNYILWIQDLVRISSIALGRLDDQQTKGIDM